MNPRRCGRSPGRGRRSPTLSAGLVTWMDRNPRREQKTAEGRGDRRGGCRGLVARRVEHRRWPPRARLGRCRACAPSGPRPVGSARRPSRTEPVGSRVWVHRLAVGVCRIDRRFKAARRPTRARRTAPRRASRPSPVRNEVSRPAEHSLGHDRCSFATDRRCGACTPGECRFIRQNVRRRRWRTAERRQERHAIRRREPRATGERAQRPRPSRTHGGRATVIRAAVIAAVAVDAADRQATKSVPVCTPISRGTTVSITGAERLRHIKRV